MFVSNVTSALQILLTIPITVTSAEMTQTRLAELAQISIENDIASELDYSALIDDLAAKDLEQGLCLGLPHLEPGLSILSINTTIKKLI